MKKALIVLAVLRRRAGVLRPAFASRASSPPITSPGGSPPTTSPPPATPRPSTPRTAAWSARGSLRSAWRPSWATISPWSSPPTRSSCGRTADRYRAIQLSDIRLGDHVRVTGTIDRSDPKASPSSRPLAIVASSVVAPNQIKWFAFRGPIKAVDATAARSSPRRCVVTRGLWDVLGVKTTFVVAPNARIFTWVAGKPVVLTLAELTAGEHVLAQGSIDRSVPATPVFTIKWMRVWEPTPAS